MANKSVLELAVQTGQWDAGLKKAKTALQNFTDASGGLQKALTEDSASMQKFVQMMGRTDSQAKTAKGQLNDYKSTIEQLTMQYNQMNDAQKQSIGQDYLRSIDQLKQKYQAVNQQIQEMNRSLAETPDMKPASGGGGLFGGGKLDGMLQVFGGNLMTKGAGMALGLAAEMKDMVAQGIELAKQGEGIRIAFERLGRGDILQGLREATHGTVTDLELMKAAVKFNDFKLPLDELGTMLAFAQQKAKDTGQSVDYMVDSIVTGLGRKSLMILDNLGLSAAQIKEKMAETGDMTKAVGAIIREEMAKAGDYVETAADRATQANVSLQNKMEELGRKFAPLEEASNNFWTSMKIGILDVVGGPLTNLLNKLTEAGRLMGAYGKLGGNTKVNRMVANLAGARQENRQSIYQQQQSEIWKYINPREQQLKDIRAWQRGERNDALKGRIQSITAQYGSLDATKIQAEVDAAKKMLTEYQQAAKSLLTPVKADINTDDAQQSVASLTKKLKELQEQRKKVAAGSDEAKNLDKQIRNLKADIKLYDPNAFKTTTTHKPTTAEQIAFDINKAGISSAKGVDTMPSVFGMLKDSGAVGINGAMGSISPDLSAEIEKQTALVDELREKWAKAGGELRDSYITQIIEAEDKLRNLKDEQEVSTRNTPQFDAKQDISKQWKVGKNGQISQQGQSLAEDGKNVAAEWQSAASAISAVGAAMSQIEDPAAKVMGTVAQAIATIALTFSQSLKGTVTPWDWIAAAVTGTATMISTISAIHSATGYANGGIVQGNSYSGDNIGAMVDNSQLVGLNAGEVVLNKSQQSTLATQLQGSGVGSMQLEAVVRGEDLRFVLNSNGRRTGRGEIVTTNFR